MAHENGYEIKKYLQKNMDNYAEDSLIFTKALSILNTYMNRVDWPYCMDEMIKTTLPILGDSIFNLWSVGEAIENLIIEQSEGDFDQYKIDVMAFYKTIKPIMEQYYGARYRPLKLASIVYAEKNQIKFIRNDGQTFDIEVAKEDVNYMIDILMEISGGKGN
ncbi:hypothetical protein COL80_11255 [Bacillus thuringiensis]|uniref:hypothetical protein n=1 Tax=Bacillus thuringiensis TaxID=1428 RepID=UPI000BF28FF5|nr:hypothetical protein [Bacillus thuringiensis]PGA26753.1 hypothetical protein COL80_11255 [Bacillus thuringiensis]